MNTDVEKLRSEKLQLKCQLKSLVQNARLNEEKMLRFSEMELLLIGTHSLRDLLKIIITTYRNVFDLDKVSLVLIDQDYELLRFLDETGLQLDQLPGLKLFADSAELEAWFDHDLLPILTHYEAGHESLFSPLDNILQSVALVPLVRQGRLIGSLNLGSHEADRFQESNSTDFLQRLAAIISICFENSLNISRLERVGMTDALTCVYNRRFFEQRLVEIVSNSIRHQYELSCMFLDVDWFKTVNDSQGHQVGDLVLQEVAGIINEYLRAGDMMARYGGEEFVVLLPQTPISDALAVAERIRKKMASHQFNLAEGKTLSLTLSIGVASMCVGDLGHAAIELGRDLVKRADNALLSAKSSGRNKVVSAEEMAEAAGLPIC